MIYGESREINLSAASKKNIALRMWLGFCSSKPSIALSSSATALSTFGAARRIAGA